MANLGLFKSADADARGSAGGNSFDCLADLATGGACGEGGAGVRRR